MEEIINSVMQSPENTNPNVLRSQLQGISGGSGGGAFVVGVDPETEALDKTAREIMDAMPQKSVCIYVNSPSVTAFAELTEFMHRDGSPYEFTFGKNMNSYYCSSENDYPTQNGSGH